MTQERQDGWYWVRLNPYSTWEPARWVDSSWTWRHRAGYADDYFAEYGPRIPSPDEPNALLDVAQKAQELMLAIDHDYQALSAQVVIAAKAGTLREALAGLRQGQIKPIRK
jgi:hypothetical protein